MIFFREGGCRPLRPPLFLFNNRLKYFVYKMHSNFYEATSQSNKTVDQYFHFSVWLLLLYGRRYLKVERSKLSWSELFVFLFIHFFIFIFYYFGSKRIFGIHFITLFYLIGKCKPLNCWNLLQHPRVFFFCIMQKWRWAWMKRCFLDWQNARPSEIMCPIFFK